MEAEKRFEIIINELSSIVGGDDVLTGNAIKVYGYDASPLITSPLAVVRVENSREVSDVLRFASEYGIPVTPRGSGTSTAGNSAGRGIVVDMKKMNKFHMYSEFILEAEPGAIMGQIKKYLEQKGLFLPPEPGSVEICTIGGFVANAGSGKRGLKYGTIRDYVQGIEVVLPDGSINFVGTKQVKDCGYGVHSLFVGSEGTLGIITRIWLKVLPLPTYRRTFVCEVEKLEDCVKATLRVLRCMPDSVEFMDGDSASQLGFNSNLLAVEFASHLPSDFDEAAKILEKFGATHVLEGEEEEEFWRKRSLLGAELGEGRRVYAGDDIIAPISELPSVIELVKSIATKYGFECFFFGHLDTGNIHPIVIGEEGKGIEFSKELYSEVKRRGWDIGEHGYGEIRKELLSDRRSLMEKIKGVFDPLNIMNPGRIL